MDSTKSRWWNRHKCTQTHAHCNWRCGAFVLWLEPACALYSLFQWLSNLHSFAKAQSCFWHMHWLCNGFKIEKWKSQTCMHACEAQQLLRSPSYELRSFVNHGWWSWQVRHTKATVTPTVNSTDGHCSMENTVHTVPAINCLVSFQTYSSKPDVSIMHGQTSAWNFNETHWQAGNALQEWRCRRSAAVVKWCVEQILQLSFLLSCFRVSKTGRYPTKTYKNVQKRL